MKNLREIVGSQKSYANLHSSDGKQKVEIVTSRMLVHSQPVTRVLNAKI